MMDSHSPAKPFLGVRFVLFGFDPVSEPQVRAKLLNGGGVDVVPYSQNCTHVIVDKIVYDDPRCVNARNEGKAVVTALWVDHSHDIGMAVDITSIMYRPPRNLKGIPGANNFIVCLTGYLRQDREDIMTMVSLMGAQFSKPLVANKVTHLICYKFEGEKYLLANKLKTIKLVNHHWLEDCLRDWEILPEDNYSKSGYEMEMMEAEAKDSEEDAENITERQLSRKVVNKSPQLKIETPKHSPLPKSIGEGQKVHLNLSEPENEPSAVNDMTFTGRKIGADLVSGSTSNNVPVELVCLDAGTSSSIPNPQEGSPNTRKGDSVSLSVSTTAEKSHFDSRFSAKSYTRKSPQEFPSSFYSGVAGNISGSPKMQLGEPTSITSSAKGRNAKDVTGSGHAEYLQGSEVSYKEASSSKNQKLDVSSSSLEQQNDLRATVTGSPLVGRKNQQSGSLSLVDDLSDINKYTTPDGKCGIVGASAVKRSQTNIASPKSPTSEERPSIHDPLFNGNLTREALQDEGLNGKTPRTLSRGTTKSGFVSKPECGDSDVEKSRPSIHGMLFNENLTPEALQDEGLNGTIPRTLSRGTTKSGSVSKPECGDSDVEKSRPSIHGMLFNENLTPEALRDEGLNGTTLRTLSTGTRKSGFVSKPECGDSDAKKSELEAVEARTHLHQQEENQVPSPSNRNKEAEKCQMIDNMEELQEGNDDLLTKRVRKKATAKRTWGGSRPTLKKAAKQKGSIYSNKAVVQNDPQICLSRETAADAKSNNADESETAVNVTEAMEVETKTNESSKHNVTEVMEVETEITKSSKDNIESEANFMDDETEPPEDKHENVDVHNEDNSEGTDLLHKADNMNINPEGAQHSAENISSGVNDSSKEEESIQRQQKNEATCKLNSRNMKVCKGRQKALGKTQPNTIPSVFEETKSGNDLHIQGTSAGKNSKGKATKRLKAKPNSKANVKSKLGSRKKSDSFLEVEKENNPIVDGDESTGPPIENVENGVASNTASREIEKKSRKRKNSHLPLTEDKKLVKVEPVCFILSGHRLQRKEFQQVIRRLKGKFCRDSHQWSYQATHFIAPDPIRRTEKFFAAVASGRWILKTDYLSASSQAGRFLDEEPHEWHKNGLNEDGTINLEAPRKWRLLREKTGHGAFYGMRIIIYGECIAPPLDTLKRVVKAGDGTILATSPPYNRFLTSGVDFAVVSPGMPHVDLWVQEFLRHEIPCVVADYLVEYVCKPGYSLEKHVLYNTHAWAEKSVKNLSSKAEEIVIVKENLPSDDHSDESDDIACEVCGSCDRGDVMLICGDESGSSGCGKGMHIDCCDPPLQSIPEDDWFCPECSNNNKNSNSSNNSKVPLKKRRKGSSVKNK